MTFQDHLSRRQFASLMGSFLSLATMPLWARQALAAAGPDVARAARRLVFVELFGGNDALNTLVPYKDPIYYHLRPTIGLTGQEILPLNSDMAFNAAWRQMADLYHNGEIAIIQDVGYPDSNLSHFKSAEIWAGASSSGIAHGGWIGQTLQANRAKVGPFDADGVVLSGNQDLLEGEGMHILTVDNKDALRAAPAEGPVPINADEDHTALAYLTQLMADQQQVIARVAAKLQRSNRFEAWFTHNYYMDPIDAQTALLLWMIDNDVKSPLFKISIGGFDQHSNLRGEHERLLGKVQSTLMGLRRGLNDIGVWDDTLVIVHSEFGRRPAENASGGTDHGSCSPVFLMGGGVKPGLGGTRSDLEKLDAQGNPVFTTDFRSVYASVIGDFWRFPVNPIAQQGFAPLALF
ncbi:DUF1501 domain-containing protein [Rhizobium sp.]|jgi:uncharacterized protein (DUF1501 family)|uniref:DUF1501 domain-containing protein n=1 Tax=Rhizobium sp. TaxID=391 RepID=UPI000E8A14FA|nr:hypothetical protein [Rhizobium sp.]